MSEELWKNTKFKSKVKNFFNKNKEKILDIVLFGSSVKGKEKPNDIDILIIYKEKKDIDLSYELKKSLKEYNAEITDKTYLDLFDESFNARESILSEGYSLVNDNFLSQGIGYLNMFLFKYELKGFNKSERMRFYYSLYGRTKEQKGVLKELDSVKFSETIILCPISNSEKMKEYLENWNVKFIEFPILIPSRIKNILK